MRAPLAGNVDLHDRAARRRIERGDDARDARGDALASRVDRHRVALAHGEVLRRARLDAKRAVILDRQQRHAGRGLRAGIDEAGRDDAVDRRAHLRVAGEDAGLGALRGELLARAARPLELRARDRGLGANFVELRRADGAARAQRGKALLVRGRQQRVGLGRGDGGVRPFDGALDGIAGGPRLAVVDLGEELPGADTVALAHVHRDDVPHHLRRQRADGRGAYGSGHAARHRQLGRGDERGRRVDARGRRRGRRMAAGREEQNANRKA